MADEPRQGFDLFRARSCYHHHAGAATLGKDLGEFLDQAAATKWQQRLRAEPQPGARTCGEEHGRNIVRRGKIHGSTLVVSLRQVAYDQLMTANRGLALFRFFFAALCLAAIASQFAYNVANIEDYKPGNFFSFFTIESNIIATVAFAVAGWFAWHGRSPRWLELLRGGATMYMAITGIIYSLLLSNIQVDTAVPWVNVVLHYTMPTVLVIDWLVDLPQRRISVRESFIFLVFPVLYLAYSLIRGPIVDWYPYPFLDPRIDGYGQVAVMSVLVAVVAFVLALVIAWSTRLRSAVPYPAALDVSNTR